MNNGIIDQARSTTGKVTLPPEEKQRKQRRGLRKTEISQLVQDLAKIGYCIKDIGLLTQQCQNGVKRMLDDEELEVGTKPGRMVSEKSNWFQSADSWMWGSIYLQHLTQVLERLDDPYLPQGVCIRDATRITDWRYGIWDEEPMHRRARLVLMLTNSLLAGEVDLKKCGECGFRYMQFQRSVAIRSKRKVLPRDCPCCATTQRASDSRKNGLEIQRTVVRASMGGLFED